MTYKSRRKIEKLSKLNESLGVSKVYGYKKNDKVDEGLANFINNYPMREELVILFVRESEGMYRFGQRRVHIKIENGNQILVKVGGGFMNIREFIDRYYDQEVVK